MKYNYNQIQDFLNDESFVRWAIFKENQAQWQQFLIENPESVTVADEAQQLILEINLIEEERGLELNKKNVWHKVLNSMNEYDYAEKPMLKLWQKPTLKWAASLIIMLGISWLVWNNKPKGRVTYQALVESIEGRNAVIERINRDITPLRIELEDGSTVVLEKNSRITYPNHFGSYERKIILSGDAFFEIAKNSKKPFYVYANEVVTKVLGTSFRVQAFDDDKKVIVKVKTGKVSVFNQREVNLEDPETDALILLPNQQAIYSRNTENLNRRLVEEPIPIIQASTKNLPNNFDEAPISKFFDTLEKRYGIKIIFNEEVLSNCFITTKIRDESLHEQLDLICTIIGGTYKEVDAQIVIESKGCK
jgi:transmembrane sensor